MKLMRTAEEMIQFCVDHKTGCYSYKYLDHFKVIEECLQTDEYVLFCFEGAQMIERGFSSKRDRCYSFALTNRRLIMSQRSGIGDELKIVWYEDLRAMEVVNKSLVVNSTKNVPCIQILSEDVSYLREKIPVIMEEIKRKRSAVKTKVGSSPADEIRKYRGLCDDGIITEEEFQKKKEQLLNSGDTSGQTEMGTEVAIEINPADYMSTNEKAAGIGPVELAKEEKAASSNKRWKVICCCFVIWLIVMGIIVFLP